MVLAGRTFGFLLVCAAASQLAATPKAFAWGDAGHRIVCQLAYLELSPAAKAKVDALIALDPKFHTFAAACTWPDMFPPQRPAEHFLNVPRDAKSIDPAKLCPTADRCVASAILGDARDLKAARDKGESLRLLKSLGHWVGDIHQPLHVSFEDDKGANYIGTTGACVSTLHLAWDMCIVDRLRSSSAERGSATNERSSSPEGGSALNERSSSAERGGDSKNAGADETAVAAALEAGIRDEDRKNWMPANLDAAQVASWANESLAIAQDPYTQYCFPHTGGCWYSPEQRQFAGQKREVRLTEDYLETETPVVRGRLQRAGVRLGAILNKIFSD